MTFGEDVINNVRVYEVNKEVDLTYGSFSRSFLSSLVVRVTAGDVNGWGECSNRKPFLKIFDPRKIAYRMGVSICGRTAYEPSRILKKFPWLPLSWDYNSMGYNRAIRVVREAFSIALYDLVARLNKMPLYEYLGGAKRKRMSGMPVVHVSDPERMMGICVAWKEVYGFRHVKLKLDSNQPMNLRRLESIRKAMGSDHELHIDYNYAYGNDYRRAIRDINQLDAEYGIVIAEDPIWPQLRSFSRIRREISPMLMVDTRAYWPRVKHVIRRKAADIINHHPNQQGGIDLAILINETASKAGIKSAIGSSGLVGIQDAAFQVLGSIMAFGRPCEAVGFQRYADRCFDGYYGMKTSPSVLLDDREIQDGHIILGDKPGLGVDVDESMLGKPLFSVSR